MTPRVFTERMRAVIAATKGEPDVRGALALDLMRACLFANGFADGLALLDAASPEKIPDYAAAEADDAARRSGR